MHEKQEIIIFFCEIFLEFHIPLPPFSLSHFPKNDMDTSIV